MADNAFVRIDDWSRAQELADSLSPDQLHRTLDRYAEQCCPVSDAFGQSYHWSLMQVEYATDLAFRSAATLGPLYEQLVRETVLSVKAEQVATFLGRQITPLLAQEIGSQFSTRIEGTCVKHRFGKCLDQDVRQVRHRAAHRDHRPTTCPSSSTTERWNTASARQLRDIGVIKRVTGTYRYYPTKAGRAAAAAAGRLTETAIVPAMI